MTKTNHLILIVILAFLSGGSLTAASFHWEVVTNLNNASCIHARNDSILTATTGGFFVYQPSSGQVTRWTSENGLSDQNFTAITESDRGILVLGSNNGIITFLDLRSGEYAEEFSLKGNPILSLTTISDTLWALSKDMVAVFLYDQEKEHYTFRDFFSNFGISFNTFRQILYFKNQVWVASDNGLLSAPGNFLKFNLKSASNWSVLSTGNGLPSANIYSLASQADTLLVGTGQGLAAYDGVQFRQYKTGLSSRTLYHIKILEDTIYVDNSRSIYRLNGQIFEEIHKIQPNVLNDFTIDPSGEFWGAVREKGLKNLDTGKKLYINGPTDNNLGKMMLDSRGRLWALTGTHLYQQKKGFSVLEPTGTWRNYRYIEDWRFTANPGAIMEDPEGNIWMGTWNGGFIVFDQNLNFHHFNNYTTQGKLWVFSETRDDTLEFQPPDSVHYFFSYTQGAPELLVVTDFLLDRRHQSIWMLALTTVGRRPIVQFPYLSFNSAAYDSSVWRRYEIPAPLVIENDQVADLTQDIFGNLWVGTEKSGVFSIQLDANGNIDDWLWLTKNDNLKNEECWAVEADQDGYVWIGTHEGLNAYFNGQVVDFREDFQPLGLRINGIVVDSENNKWFATDKGLSLLKASGSPWDPNSWVHFVPNSSDFFGPNIYHTNLPAEEIRSVFVDDNSGDVYCGTPSGLAIMRSNPFTTPLPDLNRVKTGPNPLIIGNESVNNLFFRNLTRNSQIKILTPSGRLVRVLDGGRNEVLGSFAQWDGRNDAGKLVSSGVYLYLVMDENGKSAAGKVVVIRK